MSMLLPIFAACSHIIAVTLLSLRRSHLSKPLSSPSSIWPLLTSVLLIRYLGIISAIATLATPYAFAGDPILQPALRCVCFFYACKILDLSLARAQQPPKLVASIDGKQEPQPTSSSELSYANHVQYIFRLLTEMRYFSFDISARQRGRPNRTAAEEDPLTSTWTWLPPLMILALTYLFPVPETKCLAVLLCIQLGLESLHTVCHFHRQSCSQALFYKPFAADSFSSFWTTHWHAAAAPFLQSLAYQPGKRLLGRWFGVLAAFNLTGLWHAWASAPLVEEGYAFELAFRVWAVFMVMGVGILMERVVWGERQGGWVQKVVVWSVALLAAGWAYRSLECHSRIDLLRTERCRG